MRLFDLTGKTALVTGARSGIGQAIALAFADHGADIVGLGSQAMPDMAARVVARGRKFKAIRCDLEKRQDLSAVVADATSLTGRIDILVNNAGRIRRAPSLEMSAEDWDSVMDINLRSAFFLSQAAGRLMAEKGQGGRIINIASVLTFQGGLRVASYTTSKHGLAGLTKAMANDLAGYRITVNAIAPGYIETDNTVALRNDTERYNQILARIPVGRWGKPDDLATAALFLASPHSGFVTGSVVSVDGGWLAR
jgi:2-deoxy-D-gluconate 3-dehydrogenase